MLEIFNIAITIILLGIIIYFNVISQDNVKEGKRIIVNNPAGYCPPKIEDVPDLSKSDLTPCEPNSDFSIYKSNSKNVTNYILSSTETVFYKTVCDTLIGKEKENCLSKLQPPKGCSNSSKPFGSIGDTFYYAVGVYTQPGKYSFCLTPSSLN